MHGNHGVGHPRQRLLALRRQPPALRQQRQSEVRLHRGAERPQRGDRDRDRRHHRRRDHQRRDHERWDDRRRHHERWDHERRYDGRRHRRRRVHGHLHHGEQLVRRLPGRGEGHRRQLRDQRLDRHMDAVQRAEHHPGVERHAGLDRQFHREGEQRLLQRIGPALGVHHLRLPRQRLPVHPDPHLHEPVRAVPH
ncbi:hypothetical protein SBRY_100085 [Actinacidiphila bryophytorum]|uniref:Uncharacterized protein n=1 Tax=Actinacidiphila bryophytorum TaxID=1436133 RepID=A0A9W4ECP0_9ACTN|nr:hypothetical protein SBRY_100085 [Actinacidiphila bryophytorum]